MGTRIDETYVCNKCVIKFLAFQKKPSNVDYMINPIPDHVTPTKKTKNLAYNFNLTRITRQSISNTNKLGPRWLSN